MTDNINFYVDPEFKQSLTNEQLATLEKVERLGELNPEVTARLSRALDRLQLSQPYQQIRRGARPSASSDKEAPPSELTEEERAAREELINQELGALLAIAGQLNQVFEDNRLKAQADRTFREQLKAQFK